MSFYINKSSKQTCITCGEPMLVYNFYEHPCEHFACMLTRISKIIEEDTKALKDKRPSKKMKAQIIGIENIVKIRPESRYNIWYKNMIGKIIDVWKPQCNSSKVFRLCKNPLNGNICKIHIKDLRFIRGC